MMLDPVQRGDALYAGLVEESREAWQRLSDSASLPILTPCEAVTALAAADVALEARGADRLTGEQLRPRYTRSEEHTSELQSLMRISYAVFCLKKKNITTDKSTTYNTTPTNNEK